MSSLVFKQNKLLFSFSLLLFFQVLCIFWGFVFSVGLYSYWTQLKSTSSLSLGSSQFDLFDYLWRSGQAMTTHATIHKTTGYSNNNLELIKKFFTSGDTVSTVASSNGGSQNIQEIAKFTKFNYCLQTIVGLISIFSFCTLANLLVFCKLVWNYLLEANTFNFKKLFACLFFNIFAFSYFYLLEKELFKSGELDDKYRKSEWLKKSLLRKLVLKLKGVKKRFDSFEKSEDLLVVKNLYFSADPKSSKKTPVNYILRDVNLTIKRGSFNIIIGPNGSGKTTLLKSIVNLYDNKQGQILWNGQEISTLNRASFARKVSYIPQFLDIENEISLSDFLQFARYPYKTKNVLNEDKEEEIINKAIIEGGCAEFSDKFIDQLSGGQKQKALLTSILAQESEVIILDEPTSFLDIKNQYHFLQTVKAFHEKGKTIIMILHDLQQSINYADNLIVMKSGEIKATGHPSQIVTPELLYDIFSINCEIRGSSSYMRITNIRHA